jgi:Undecaprenyl-phosphate galactose phosphotransferase WbaP
VGESTEQRLPEFSARRVNLHGPRLNGDKLLKEVGPERVHRPRGRVVEQNIHITEQFDQARPNPSPGHESHHALPNRPISRMFKRVLDIAGATLLGIVFLPLIVAVAVLLRLEGGRIIFRHRRVGRKGQAFDCLKFRTMVPDADRVLREVLERHPKLKAEWLLHHKLRDDPRITSLGRFLRRTSLDELPQLWNVVRGEMSLVGPRPVVREELLRYGRHLHRYLAAKPGITGLWQVTGRNDTDYRRRVVLDVYYVRRQSALLDFYILLKTTQVVLGGSGAY